MLDECLLPYSLQLKICIMQFLLFKFHVQFLYFTAMTLKSRVIRKKYENKNTNKYYGVKLTGVIVLLCD